MIRQESAPLQKQSNKEAIRIQNVNKPNDGIESSNGDGFNYVSHFNSCG